ncbi:MAG: glutaredoxin family protein [Candidatus Obscuribacterales bacterium]|nr:glutaredoxin family protein [Steroidobacteraceae bacterium]
MSSRWIVYSRPHCGLCEEFAIELAALLGDPVAATVEVIDVDSDPELKRKYGERIPVLTVDGDYVCAIRVDVERVSRFL